MAVPKKRTSHSKRGKRRSHLALKKISLAKCSDCGEPTLPHRVCPNCNRFKGKLILPLEG